MDSVAFLSFSKRNFYLRSQISAFVLQNNHVPISPFMNFDYNLSGIVNKDLIRVANNTLIDKAGTLWVFGEVSDGVLVEIFLAMKRKIPVRYFNIDNKSGIFQEISLDEVRLEDVSPWVWEWVQSGKNLARWHPRLRFNKKYPIIYPAYSKKNFYWQMHISKFCIEKKSIPLNPFMLFRYFLGDSVPREKVYKANRRIISLCDELWVFGDVSDGMYEEIKQMELIGKPIKYFKINDNKKTVNFRKIDKQNAIFEDELINQVKNQIK